MIRFAQFIAYARVDIVLLANGAVCIGPAKKLEPEFRRYYGRTGRSAKPSSSHAEALAEPFNPDVMRVRDLRRDPLRAAQALYDRCRNHTHCPKRPRVKRIVQM